MSIVDKKEKIKSLNEEYTITNKSIGYLIDSEDFLKNNPTFNVSKIKEKIEKTVNESGMFFASISLQDKIDTMRDKFKKETHEILKIKKEIQDEIVDAYFYGKINVKETIDIIDTIYNVTRFPYDDVVKILSVAKSSEDFDQFVEYANKYSPDNLEIEILKTLGRNEELAENVSINSINFEQLKEFIKTEVKNEYEKPGKIINEIILDQSIEIGNIRELISPENIDYTNLDELSFRSDLLINALQDRIEKRINEGKGITDISNFILNSTIMNFINESEFDKFTRNINLLSMETKSEEEVDILISSISSRHADIYEPFANKMNMITSLKNDVDRIISISNEISLLNMATDYYLFDYDETSVMPEGNISIERMQILTNNTFKKDENDEKIYQSMLEDLNIKSTKYEEEVKILSEKILDFMESRVNDKVETLGVHKFLNHLDENKISNFAFNNIIFSQLKNKEEFDFIVNGMNGEHKINLEQSIILNLIKDSYAYDKKKKEGYLDIQIPKMFENLVREVGDNIFNYCDNFSNCGDLIIDNQKIYEKVKKEGLIKTFDESQKRKVVHNLLVEALNEEQDAGSSLRQAKILKTVKSLGVEGKEFNDMFVKIRDNISKNNLAGNQFIVMFEKELNIKKVEAKKLRP